MRYNHGAKGRCGSMLRAKRYRRRNTSWSKSAAASVSPVMARAVRYTMRLWRSYKVPSASRLFFWSWWINSESLTGSKLLLFSIHSRKYYTSQGGKRFIACSKMNQVDNSYGIIWQGYESVFEVYYQLDRGDLRMPPKIFFHAGAVICPEENV